MAARRSRPDAPPRRGLTVTSKGIVIREAHFPGRAPIEAYGNGGFRFADMSHRGSLLCLPSGIHGWEPVDSLALTVADFDRLLSEADKIEILLVGMGRDLRPLPAALRAALKAAGIASDPMSTGAAVRTYNVLLAEERAVAAALIAVD
ncbi:Mth938-like domain-containing protein [Mesorhizobium sp. ISC11]|uniref:Mth938-like domain-containing protein n=1 Tax=Mesorhizobium sp. ISC11 TaxID=3076428 RepID=UPI00301DBFC8